VYSVVWGGTLSRVLIARPAYCLIRERIGDGAAVDTAVTQQRLRKRRVVVLDRRYHLGHQPADSGGGVLTADGVRRSALPSAGARYRWDGEETYGMLERSSPMDKLTR